MDGNFIKTFCRDYTFPDEAVKILLEYCDRINKNGEYEKMFSEAEDILFAEEVCEAEKYLSILDEISEKSGMNKNTLYLLFHISAAKRLNVLYDEKGIDEKIRFETMEDLLFKMNECRKVTGIYGLYSPRWLYGYYRAERFAFGRMQYEISQFTEETKVGDAVIKNGDKAVRIHIPASERPFDREARRKSYKRAYDFFKGEFPHDVIPFVCTSWLLAPINKEILSEKSNIIDFMNEFKIVAAYDNQNYHAYRIFGQECGENLSDLPEDTSIRRLYKKRMIDGTGIQNGCGIFLFDGENIRKDDENV